MSFPQYKHIRFRRDTLLLNSKNINGFGVLTVISYFENFRRKEFFQFSISGQGSTDRFESIGKFQFC